MRAPSPATDDIVISERYDQEDDIYYVSLRTGEPSLAEENDDQLLVEIGIFTGMPTGFRIFNYSKNKTKADVFKARFKEVCKRAGLRKLTAIDATHRRIDKFFEHVGA